MHLPSHHKSSVQLTGHLAIQLAHPTQYLRLPCLLLDPQLQKITQHESTHQEQAHPQSRSFSACPLPYSYQNSQQEQALRLQKKVETLENRVKQFEHGFTSNIHLVNEQTLNTFHQIRNQLSTKLTAHDQAFLNRTKQLTEIETNWNKKSEQQLKKQEKQNQQAERKQDEIKYKLEEEVKKRVCEILQKERKQLKQQQMQEEINEEQAKEEERKRKRELKTALIQERKAAEEEMKKLEKRIHMRIKDETHRIEILSNKIAQLLEQKQKEEQCEQLVDRTTPYASRFLIKGNSIMNQKSESSHQLLLKVKKEDSYTLLAHIVHTNSGHIKIGVVDRLTRKQALHSHSSGDAVCYDGAGQIFYGEGGKHKIFKTECKLKSGMDVRMDVYPQQGTVCFTLAHDTLHQQFSQQSDILTQPNRDFVPYFQMYHMGDSITWNIE